MYTKCETRGPCRPDRKPPRKRYLLKNKLSYQYYLPPACIVDDGKACLTTNSRHRGLLARARHAASPKNQRRSSDLVCWMVSVSTGLVVLCVLWRLTVLCCHVVRRRLLWSDLSAVYQVLLFIYSTGRIHLLWEIKSFVRLMFS